MKINTIQDIKDFFRTDINQSYGPMIDHYAAEYNNDIEQIIEHLLIEIGTKERKKDIAYRNLCNRLSGSVAHGDFKDYIAVLNDIEGSLEESIE